MPTKSDAIDVRTEAAANHFYRELEATVRAILAGGFAPSRPHKELVDLAMGIVHETRSRWRGILGEFEMLAGK